MSTTYLSFISCTVRALLAGSSASSQPCGLPVSTAQKRQARVQTAPMSMMVAVPGIPALTDVRALGFFADGREPMFFHRVLDRHRSPGRRASGARSQVGLRPNSTRARLGDALIPSLIALKPCGVRYLSPLRDDGNAFEFAHWGSRLRPMPRGSRRANSSPKKDGGQAAWLAGPLWGSTITSTDQAQADWVRMTHCSPRSIELAASLRLEGLAEPVPSWPFFRYAMPRLICASSTSVTPPLAMPLLERRDGLVGLAVAQIGLTQADQHLARAGLLGFGLLLSRALAVERRTACVALASRRS